MKTSFSLLVFSLILVACSSGRTKYQVYKKNDGGYQQNTFESDLSTVSFRANNYTKVSTAELFAKFRAVELCREAGKKIAVVVGILDQSESKTVTRTSGGVYGFPSYYYGSPYAYRYGWGLGGGFGMMSGSSWNEKLVYPTIDVLYRCRDSIYEPEIIVKEISAEEMKHLMKDLKGAMQVEKVIDGSPNKKLEKGDIILRADQERIEKTWQLMRKFDENKRTVKLEIMRDGERRKLDLESKDVSLNVEKAQQDLIKKACEFKEIKKRPICQG